MVALPAAFFSGFEGRASSRRSNRLRLPGQCHESCSMPPAASSSLIRVWCWPVTTHGGSHPRSPWLEDLGVLPNSLPCARLPKSKAENRTGASSFAKWLGRLSSRAHAGETKAIGQKLPPPSVCCSYGVPAQRQRLNALQDQPGRNGAQAGASILPGGPATRTHPLIPH
jgi:hypothetical protein